MALSKVLVDSSFLYALYNLEEKNHQKAAAFVRAGQYNYLVCDVVLPEVCFLFNRFGGEQAVVTFLESLEIAKPQLEPLLITDLERIREIKITYAQARLDFVDCCLMTLSERLNITQVCTFDRRDFSIFRPKHADFLELLP